MHSAQPEQVGRLPEWAAGLPAVLLHDDKLVMKVQDSCIVTAVTGPKHKACFIGKLKRNKASTLRGPSKWADEAFDDAGWKATCSSFKPLSPSKKIQISKLAHKWMPALHQQATMGNSIDRRRCFARSHLREGARHALQRDSDHQQCAQAEALNELKTHLSKQRAPAPVPKVMLEHLEKWLNKRRPTAPRLQAANEGPSAELHRLINAAYNKQCPIRWSHFLRGWISKSWKEATARCCEERQPGRLRSPALWACKAADQMWKLLRMTWLCRNGELHGKGCNEQ